MADKSESCPDPCQAEVAEALTAALRDMQKALADSSNALGTQADQLNRVLDGMKKNRDEIDKTTKSTEDLNKELEDYRHGSKQQLQQDKKTNNQMKDAVKTVGLVAIAYGSLTKAMEMTRATLGALGGGFTSVFSVIKGTIGTGISLITNFIGMGADYYNSMAGGIMQANEKIRADFGDLAGTTGKMVKGLSRDVRAASGTLAKTGRSIYGTLGGPAEQLAYGASMAAAFGNSLDRLSDHLVASAGEMLLMNKGMNISMESFKELAANAEAAGESMQDVLQSTMVTSAHLANSFGIDVKDIGKGFDKMVKDSAHFGTYAPAELLKTATYATKLGVEIESLTALMDKFDTFEGAAQSAGMLAEAFGMNIDAMQMMNANNPAERMDMLRRSFQETGKDINDLSRHELKMLGDQMGMTGDQIKNAMSMNVDEFGFDDISAAAEEAADKMTPEQAMMEVAKSIEKLTNGMHKLVKGPLGNFLEGFKIVVGRSPEFLGMLRTSAKWLKAFQNMGRAVGRQFLQWVRTFGDFREMWADFLNMKGLKKLHKGVTDSFGKFFKTLKTEPVKAGREIVEGLWNAIQTFIKGMGGGKGGGVLKQMFEQLLKASGGMAAQIVTMISNWIKDLASWIQSGGIEKAIGGSGVIGTGFLSMFRDALAPLGNALVDELWPALQTLATTIWTKYGDKIKEYLWKGFAAIAGVAIAYGIGQALLSAGVLKAITGAAKGLFTKISGISQTTVTRGLDQGTENATRTNSFTQEIVTVVRTVAGLKPKEIMNLAIIGGLMALAIPVFAKAIQVAADILSDTDPKDILKAAGAAITGIGMISGIAWAAKTMKGMTVKDVIYSTLMMGLSIPMLQIALPEWSKGIKKSAGIVSGINPEDVAKVALIGVAGAVMVGQIAGTISSLAAVANPMMLAFASIVLIGSVGLVGFALPYFIEAFKESADKVNDLNLEQIAKVGAIGVLGAAMVGGILFAVDQLSSKDPKNLATAALIVGASVPLVGYAIPAFAEAFQEAAAKFKGSDLMGDNGLKLIGLVTASTILGLTSVAAMVLTAGFVAKIASPASLVIAAVIVGAAAVFAGWVIPKFAEAVQRATVKMKDVKPEQVEKVFSAIWQAMAVTGTLILAGAGMAALISSGPVGAVGMVLIIAGMFAAAEMIGQGVMALTEAIIPAVKSITLEQAEKASKLFGGLKDVMDAMRPLIYVGALLASDWTGGNQEKMTQAFVTIADFVSDITSSLTRMLQNIAQVVITDPERFKMKMEAIAKLMEGISSIAMVGVELAKVATMGDIFGGSDAATLVKAVAGFLDSVTKSIETIISKTLELVQGVSVNQLEKVSVVGDIIASIAKLVEATMGPMSTLTELAKHPSFKVGIGFYSVEQKGALGDDPVGSIFSGLQGLLKSLVTELPDLIKNLVSAISVVNPEEMKSKGEALVALMTAISSMTNGFFEISEKGYKHAEKIDGINTGSEGVINAMRSISNSFGNKEEIANFASALKNILQMNLGSVNAEQLELFGKQIEISMKLATVVMDMGSKSTAMALDIMNAGGSVTLVMKAMTKFMDGIIDNIKSIMDLSVKMTQGKSEKDLRGIEVVGSIINSIATLVSALMKPLELVQAVQKQPAFSFMSESAAKGPDTKGTVSSIFSTIKSFMSSLRFSLPPMLESVINVVNTIKSPKTLTAKAKALGEVISTVGNIISVLTETSQTLLNIKEKYGLAGNQSEILKDALKIISDTFGDSDVIGPFSKAMNDVVNMKLGKLTKKSLDLQAKRLDASIGFVMDITKMVMDLESMKTPAGAWNEQLSVFSTNWENLTIAKSNPANIVESIATEINAINAALTRIRIPDVNGMLKPVGDILQFTNGTGNKTITVETKQVNIQLSVNVSMDATDLALTMHQGTKKKNNNVEGFFSLTESGAKKADLIGDHFG